MKFLETILVIASITIFLIPVSAQEKYCQVKIFAPEVNDKRVALLGLLQIDHFVYSQDGGLIVEIGESSIAKLKTTSYKFEILIPDIKKQLEELNAQYFSSLKTKKGNVQNRVAIEQPISTVSSIISTPSHFVIPSTFGGYWSFAQMDSIMTLMAATYPSICQKISIGKTFESRDIWLMKISDNVTVDESNEPEVLYMGLQHAREAIGGSSMIFFLEYLCENYAINPQIKNLVDNREIYIIPCFNPDGWEYNRVSEGGVGGMWRKNRSRIDSTITPAKGKTPADTAYEYGVDLNRNWGVDWANCSSPISGSSSSCGSGSKTSSNDTYWGSSAFSELETKAVRNFAKAHHLIEGFDQHSYGPYYSLPFGRKELHVGEMTVKTQNFYTAVPALMGTYNGMRAADSYDALGYEVAGGFKDWMLVGEIGVGTKDTVWAMTGEGSAGGGVSGNNFWAPASQIVTLSKSMCFQNLQLAFAAGSYVDIQDNNNIGLSSSGGNLNFTIKRLGLGNDPVTITLVPIENIQSVGPSFVINSIPTYYETINSSISYNLSPGLINGQRIRYAWKVQTGGYSYTDTVIKFYNPTLLLFDDMEGSFSANWIASSDVADTWNYTTLTAFGGIHSMTESPAGNYTSSTNRIVTYKNAIDLSNNTAAYLTFWTKYRAENFRDKLQVQGSTDGTTWTPIAGTTTVQEPGTLDGSTLDGKPALTGIRDYWTHEVFDLSATAYRSANFHLRFVFSSDNDPSSFKFERDDGFYIDNLSVMKTTLPLVTLAAKFLNFTGALLPDNTVKLNWDASIDQDHDYFLVERSADGRNFVKIGQGSQLAPYSYPDVSPLGGKNYYRIKEMNKNGSFIYSNVISVNVGKENKVDVFPNPVIDILSIRLKNAGSGELRAEIADINGKTIYNAISVVNDNTGRLRIDMSSFRRQVYILRLSNSKGEVISIQKLIKL